MQQIHIDHTWTLFLDRDGVINKNIDGGYVLNREQFEFIDGVLETMPKLAQIFPRIIVVTNQQCIAKGLLTEEGLNEIHQHMMNKIEVNGGRIDAVYYAPGIESETDTLRKPKNGMALLAKNDFPEIDFTKCIMVGDKLSDMKFGKSVGMTTLCISDSYKNSSLIDYKISSLPAFPEMIKC